MPSLHIHAHLFAFRRTALRQARVVSNTTCVCVCAAHVCTCSKSQKSLETLLTEIGYLSVPRYNSRAVCGAHLALRGEILQLHELRRQVSCSTTLQSTDCCVDTLSGLPV